MTAVKRAIVIGSPGSGKSTFARKLRDVTGLPLCHLDMLYHNPDRTTVSCEVFDAALEQWLALPEWIIDGSYQRTLPRRVEACTDVFLFDIPVEQCLEGAAARVGRQREDMPWIETELDAEFRQFITGFPMVQLPMIYDLLSRFKDSRHIIVFHSREEAGDWISRA